ncbi:MAG: hypothetical protein PHE59_03100 [Patescibacteria group bacterium]|nr:hypothetical protein [Patescibacteria group bacterium]MDD5164621.1 hypothetical protein [Patescibacteria group bacterium]MDD5534537.1 hypothetical protein [Patescibacteria group bacterium]
MCLNNSNPDNKVWKPGGNNGSFKIIYIGSIYCFNTKDIRGNELGSCVYGSIHEILGF